MIIFGVWMWPKSVREYGAEAVVARCRRMGVTDIYFLTKGLSGTVSCRSAIAPMDCDRDLLSELLCAAHACGIRVHAWFTSASDAAYKARHPESGRYHYVKGRDQGLISLADEGYLAYMADFTRELCRNYPIDGLHLDYIRYNHLVYGWSEEDQARYAAEGADTSVLRAMMDRAFPGEEGPELFFEAYRAGDPSVRALARARRKDVVHFATTLTRIARAEKPGLTLSAALMPEGAYEDVAFSDVHYGQNYEDAAKLYDYVLPMAYSKAYGKDGAWVRQVAEGTARRGLRTVMGLHAYEGGTGDTLREDIAALKGAPIEGVCLFREGAFVMAQGECGALWVFNPLDKAVTGLSDGTAPIPLDAPILPGEERRLPIAAPARLKAFTEDGEVCIFLAP